MNRALKVVLLLVLVIVVPYAGRRIAESYPWRMKVNSPDAWKGAEMVTVEAAIEALMYYENITDLSKYADNATTWAPVRTYEAGEATNDMSIFPSAVWHVYDGSHGYMRVPTTKCYYTVEHDGTVRQFADPAKTEEYTYNRPEPTPEERRADEENLVQDGVRMLMEIEELADLSLYADGTPTESPLRTYDAGEATNDMSVFPSAVWHLYREPDEGTTMFFRVPTTECYYTVEHDGTVRQFADAAKTVEYA